MSCLYKRSNVLPFPHPYCPHCFISYHYFFFFESTESPLEEVVRKQIFRISSTKKKKKKKERKFPPNYGIQIPNPDKCSGKTNLIVMVNVNYNGGSGG